MYETKAPQTVAIRDAALIDPEILNPEHPDLHAVLKRFFGYDEFRLNQEQIIVDTIAGRDVLALMPTGGGKSLCYQVPALCRPGLTVVVSPLIALMKDQVDALKKAGVPAALLNSTLSPSEASDVITGLNEGRFRLLYVAPERLMQQQFLANLTRWNVSLFAIDEAHCISEWGHDFRPEYRQMAELRLRFPDVPLMALTATATHRVRRDIVTQLGLRDPGIYVASFNRANLRYRIEPKKKAYDRLYAFLLKRKEYSGIVYCHTRKSTERLADRLRHDGFAAVPYHAGMLPEERARNQEAFLHDEVRIVCATVAFGMGVNKPNIRFVVHYDFPKNIESYYQETGRAGRDGQVADCLLLFGKNDAFNYERLIDEKPDPKEREIAREQLETMIRFAESEGCRRAELLAYFGEEYPDSNCQSCDNCRPRPASTASAEVATGPLEDRTDDARKFLACLDEIVRVGGFSVGAGQVCDVLCGSQSEKTKRFKHDQLPSHGSGKGTGKTTWTAIAGELLRAGCIERRGDNMPVLAITRSGRDLMAGNDTVAIYVASASPALEAGTGDSALFERLRALRLKLATEREVPAFVIFSDAALRQMSRDYPTTPDAMLRVSGVGQKKLADLGEVFMREIAAHIDANGKQTPVSPEEAPRPKPRLGDSHYVSLNSFREGKSPESIAAERGLAVSTIFAHLSTAAEAGEALDCGTILTPEQRREIDGAFEAIGEFNLTGVREHLGDRFDYGLLRLYRATRNQPVPA